MPYPAVSVDGFLTGPFTVNDWSGWSAVGSAGYKRTVKSHPASTSNPIRPDGTRAMSAWRHYGGWWRSPSNTEADWVNNSYPGWWQKLNGCFPTANIDPKVLQLWDGGRDTARLRALATWAERQVEYSDALRTAGQTAGMVGDLGKGMAHELESAMSRRGANLARHWKKLPGWYLQYLYGWKPLMDDISNITDRLVKGFDAGNTLHVMLKGKWKGRGEILTSNDGGTWGSYFNVDTYLLVEQRNTAVFKYAFPADRLPTLEPIGFFGGLWEAAPMSFVLDWIAPVGTWLTALDANALACYFVEGSSSEVVRTLSSRCEARQIGEPAWTATLRNYDTELIIPPYNFTRTLESPWSITSRVPFRADLNLSHAAQGLSLLSQAMKRLW